jgi:hypothetical protein
MTQVMTSSNHTVRINHHADKWKREFLKQIKSDMCHLQQSVSAQANLAAATPAILRIRSASAALHQPLECVRINLAIATDTQVPVDIVTEDHFGGLLKYTLSILECQKELRIRHYAPEIVMKTPEEGAGEPSF